MIHTSDNPGFPLMRSTLRLCAVTGACVAGVSLLAPALAGPAAAAGAACLTGAVLGLLIVWRLAPLRIDGVGIGYMLGVMPRAMIGYAAAVMAKATTSWSMPMFAGLLAAFYVATLAAEVAMLSGHLSRGTLEPERVH